MILTLAKFAFVLAAASGCIAMTAWLTGRRAEWYRLGIALLMLSFLWQPIVTFGFQFDSRANVRGWEICWTDFIALGLLVTHIRRGGRLGGWVSLLAGLWVLRLAAQALSLIHATDGEFCGFFLLRQGRGFLVFLTLAVILRTRADLEAVLCGLMLTVFWNEFLVLRQKYQLGIHQTPGAFYHQNDMGMYVVLVGAVLMAALLLRAVRPKLILPLALALACCLHSVIAGLSRASLVNLVAVLAAVTATCLLLRPDVWKLKITAALAAGGLVALVVFGPGIYQRFTQKGIEQSARTREVMNLVAAAMYEDHPVTGIGVNNYALAVHQERYAQINDILLRERGHRVGPKGGDRGVVESLYGQVRSETGLVGFVSLILIMAGTLILAAIKALGNRDPLPRALAIGIFWSLAANYAQSTIEHTLFYFSNSYLWFAWSAALVAIPWKSTRSLRQVVTQPLAAQPLAAQPAVVPALPVAAPEPAPVFHRDLPAERAARPFWT